MPKITEKRADKAEKLERVLDVLNGKYTYHRMIEDIQDAEGRGPGHSPLDEDPDSEFLYINAEYRLRHKLTNLVEHWRRAKPTQPVGDLYEYLHREGNERLLRAFQQTTKALGISSKLFDELSALQSWRTISGHDPFKLKLGLFLYMIQEQGFVNSNDPLLGADAEAKRLFMLLITSEAGTRIGKCPTCAKYFFNLSGRREFCSHKCAQKTINRKRDEKKAEILSRANRVLAECPAADWKKWLAKKTGLTLTFLTRNEKHLRIPASVRGGKQ